MDKKQVVRMIVEIIISIVIAIIINLILNPLPEDSVIITFACMSFLILFDLKIEQVNNYKINMEINKKVDRELLILQELDKYNKNIKDLNHPYFRYIFDIKYKKFIRDSADLFKGDYYTNQYRPDTFGVVGLKYTQDGGSLLAVSSVKDYWQDSFTNEYLEEQKKLIKRGVKIKRIFIFEDEKSFMNARKYMIFQKLMGINVYYINMSNPYTDPMWKNQDFLIQDEKVLIDILYDKQIYSDDLINKEHITTNEEKVKEKLELFNLLINRATKFNICSIHFKN